MRRAEEAARRRQERLRSEILIVDRGGPGPAPEAAGGRPRRRALRPSARPERRGRDIGRSRRHASPPGAFSPSPAVHCRRFYDALRNEGSVHRAAKVYKWFRYLLGFAVWPETAALISVYRESLAFEPMAGTPLFRSLKSRPFSKDHLTRVARQIRADLGLDKTLQRRDLRRTASKERADSDFPDVGRVTRSPENITDEFKGSRQALIRVDPRRTD